MRFLVLAFSLFFLPLTSVSYACSALPEELLAPGAELVAQSQQIALVRVVGSSQNNGDAVMITHMRLGKTNQSLAVLEPIKILRGEVPQRFTLSSGRLITADQDLRRDLNGHRNIGFWDQKISDTRTHSGADCRLLPGFVLGRIYLVFLDRPHFKAYEEVRSKDDLWLQAVQRMIETPNATTGVSMPISQWLSMATGIFKGSVQSCDGPTLWVDEVLKGDFPNILGFHLWWRYRERNESGTWYANPCVEGNDYLVVTTMPEETRLPDAASIIASVDNNTVDLSIAIESSEIDVEGGPKVSMETLRAFFEDRP